MNTNDIMPVLFGFGTYSEYESKMKLPNKLYFCSDTKEIYLGPDRFAFGKDIDIFIHGSGDTVSNITWNSDTKRLVIYLNDAGDSPSVVSAIQTALQSCVKDISSLSGSAISVDNTDKNDIKIGLKIAEGSLEGNVKLSQSYHGLRANVTIPEVDIQGVQPGDKILSVSDHKLASTLAVSIEKAQDGKQYIVLRGINGVEVSRFDASILVTSGMIESVTIEDVPVGGEIHKFLVITFMTSDGPSTVQVDLEEIISVYGAASGGGLTLSNNNQFSITNTVSPNTSGVNSNKSVTFGTNLTLNTITYDSHGSITGTKQITIQIPSIDSAPTLNSNNPVTSNGLYNAFNNVNTKLGSPTDAASASGTTAWSRIKYNEVSVSDLSSKIGSPTDAASSTSTVLWPKVNSFTSDITSLKDGLGTSEDTASSTGTTAWSRIKQIESDLSNINLDVIGKLILCGVNKSIASSTWVDSDDPVYLYKADVPMTGVDASYFPIVQFSDSDVSDFNLKSVVTPKTNSITIYCMTKPNRTITIPNIICFKATSV